MKFQLEPSKNKATRHNSRNIFIPQKIKNDYGKQSIEYIGCKLWNDLDTSIKCNKTIKGFRKHLKTYILCQDLNFYKILGENL